MTHIETPQTINNSKLVWGVSFILHYTIYKITNNINNKTYIGKHQTKNLNDGYFGSGKHLKRAIVKYGIENFTKEILYVFDNEQDMNAKEAELVTEEFCQRDDTYNICEGGKGGFGYINSSVLTTEKRSKNQLGKSPTEETRNKIRYYHKINNFKPPSHPNNKFWLGKTHTEKWKQNHSNIMKILQKGEKNSQYGSKWITNGIENRKIKSVDIVPEGWYYGRNRNLGSLG